MNKMRSLFYGVMSNYDIDIQNYFATKRSAIDFANQLAEMGIEADVIPVWFEYDETEGRWVRL